MKAIWRKNVVQNYLDEELKKADVSDKVRAQVDKDAQVEPDPLIVLLHGWGSNEADLPGVAEAVGAGLEWVSLRAPFPMLGYQSAYAWFEDPIISKQMGAQLAQENADKIYAWYEDALAAGDIKPDQKLVPFGFSQGGAMTSFLLTDPRFKGKFAGAVVLSGYLPFPDELQAQSELPVFHGWGDADDIVSPSSSQELDVWLSKNTAVEEHIYPNLMHNIDEAEARDIAAFLRGL
jgi:phospholipase/carboxylesterase